MWQAEPDFVGGAELGRTCPACGLPGDHCACRTPDWRMPGAGLVRLVKTDDGRGRTVTRLFGLPLDSHGLQRLASRIRNRCGLSGAVHDGIIELEGDRRETLRAELAFEGFTVVPGRG
ncbi:MAG TPA: stress response translation initiation inhibitor YciH [Gammaproteobacteria bacterium]|nr:stress response translation initiation inhibitor YciH [Gammaproteobacteria bacterium]